MFLFIQYKKICTKDEISPNVRLRLFFMYIYIYSNSWDSSLHVPCHLSVFPFSQVEMLPLYFQSFQKYSNWKVDSEC